MKNLIVANWKMNPVSREEAEKLFEATKKGVKKIDFAEVVVCPPFIYLPVLKGLALGGQNIFFDDKPFTGGVSAVMLNRLGVEYVIIGHSEVRRYLKESDEIINKKIKKSLEVGLKVILCIGETAEERDAGKKNEVLERQIKEGLSGIENLENINIAYEPVWAIGTGNNCSVEETSSSIKFIKKELAPSGVEGQNVRVLYGGSVKSENSGDYIKNAGADGLLVGGASLNPEEFIKIVNSAEKVD